MGRHIRRLGSDPNLICPRRLRPLPHRVLVNSSFHSPYGFLLWCFSVTLSIRELMSCPLSYLHATYRSYTRISPSHGKEDYWLFRGVYRLPHPYLTRIQRRLLIVASILPPTHTLHLLAILEVLQLKFRSSLRYTTSVALCSTVAIHKYPCFVALTYLPHLSTLV